MDPTDKVVAALDRGDCAQALEILMQSHGRAVYQYCLNRLHDPAVAADVHQEVFIQAYEAFGSFPRISSVGAWLFTIALHECFDALRRIRRETARTASGEVALLLEERDPRPLSDDEVASAQLGDMLQECIGKLSHESRIVVRMRYQEGLSYNDIGRICGESPSTLQMRVARAIVVLRRCLASKGARL